MVWLTAYLRPHDEDLLAPCSRTSFAWVKSMDEFNGSRKEAMKSSVIFWVLETSHFCGTMPPPTYHWHTFAIRHVNLKIKNHRIAP